MNRLIALNGKYYRLIINKKSRNITCGSSIKYATFNYTEDTYNYYVQLSNVTPRLRHKLEIGQKLYLTVAIHAARSNKAGKKLWRYKPLNKKRYYTPMDMYAPINTFIYNGGMRSQRGKYKAKFILLTKLNLNQIFKFEKLYIPKPKGLGRKPEYDNSPLKRKPETYYTLFKFILCDLTGRKFKLNGEKINLVRNLD